MGIWAKIPIERRREISAVLLLALTAALFLSLLTDGYQGSVRRPLDGIEQAPNALGVPGAWVAGRLYLVLGHGAHLLYFLTGVWGVMLFRGTAIDRIASRVIGTLLLIGALCLLLQVDFEGVAGNDLPGGLVGAFIAAKLYPWFGLVGTNVIAITFMLVGLLLATEFLFLHAFERIGHHVLLVLSSVSLLRSRLVQWRAARAERTRARQAERAARRKARKPMEPDRAPAPGSASVADDPSPGDTVASNARWESIRVQYAHANSGLAARADANPPAPTSRRGAEPLDEDVQAWQAWAETLGPAAGGPEDSPFNVEDRAAFDRPAQPHPSNESGARTAPSGDRAESRRPEPAEQDAPMFPPPDMPQDMFDPRHFHEPDIEDGPFEPDEGEPAYPEMPADASVARADSATGQQAPGGGVRPKRSKPMPRRKTLEIEELPPDYQYPKHYTQPPLDLLDPPPPMPALDLESALRATSLRLEETLKTFGIEARVTDVMRGPTITRYELEPAPGVKVSRFISLADDIALALKAHRVRVEAPIPGKGRVGIEVPNAHRDPVVLRELLESRAYQRSPGQLPLVLGKDIAGDVKVADLAVMPHLLVAGATGAGKTVCVKAVLASLLFGRTPQELQLMLIDPKMVELSIFDDIPHLITPVVTDPKKAASALSWLINEMEERYRLFAHLRVRNIEVYNESVENGEIEMEGAEAGAAESMDAIRKLPYIVCIIDELADLMMLARAEVEDAIARLAQLARAVGIHLIIATQRPSVDVLTGVIKANFPSRISFQVSSRVDSRCILDEIGAERLIGRGDMLYLPPGQSKPARIQGAFVSDEEMNRLIAYLKTQAPPQYRDEIARFGKGEDALAELEDQDDELFDEAVRVVLETGQASISMVQRRLRVGYTRAARLIDMMEIRGIVGPHCGSKAREILVDAAPTNEVNATQ